MSPRSAAVAVLAAVVLGVLPGRGGSAPVYAQEEGYTLATEALYLVDPRAGRIDVTIDASFTNTVPDPPGRYTIFTEALLAIHDGASEVRASDAAGPLAATAGDREGAYVTTVTLRTPIRYGETATFSVTYALVDGATPGVRIRPPGTVFTAWGFGTTSSVTVEFPEGYDIDVQGDELTPAPALDLTRLESGAIDNPGSWAAVVTAGRPGSFVTLRATVGLESATADVRVDAWAEDEEWGHRTLALLVNGLPVLERLIGLPYEQSGPLTVTESVSRSETSFEAQPVSGAEIFLGFDQPPFTALHEAAHIWIGPREIQSRWVYEGFASHFAAQAGAELAIDPAFDPVAVRTENSALAFPLEDWPPLGESTDDLDRYGYPASWALANEIAQRTGPDLLREVLRGVVAREPAYRPTGDASLVDTATSARVDGRRFLDHLEEVTEVTFDDLFARDVFGPEAAPVLEERRRAREALHQLEVAADGWGAPTPVLEAMNRWDFDVALREIPRAVDWLRERDAFTADLRAVGLALPEGLRETYAGGGGDDEAYAELDAQRAVLAAYRAARAELDEPATALERVGLLALPEPEAQLDLAARFFETGEIETASAGISLARDTAGRAALVGALRIATVLVLAVLTVVVLAATAAQGRRAPRRPRATLGE